MTTNTLRPKTWTIIIVGFVMFVALILRLYKVNEYAIFLSDQAIDSFAVKRILEGAYTLLGPRASVGEFFNGPIVYYLMLPFYILFRLDPLSGTYFQITLQIASIPFIFNISRRMGGQLVGYLSTIIFALSPLLIYYSRATFNAYPAIFFSTIIIWALTSKSIESSFQSQLTKNKIRCLLTFPTFLLFIAGLSTGILVQTHYLLYIYAIFYLLYVILFYQKPIRVAIYCAGVFFGLAPFILFELRHDFFNIRAIINHVLSSSAIHISLIKVVESTLLAFGKIVGFPYATAGILAIVITVWFLFKSQRTQTYRLLLFSFFATIVSILLYRDYIQTHYIIGFHIFVLITSACMITLFGKYERLLLPFIVVICWVILLRSNTFAIAPEHDGLSLLDQRMIAQQIVTHVPADLWNLSQDAQQDNRAMPIRYLISLYPQIKQPLPVENYSANKYLYVVYKTNKPLSKIRTWEVQSFGKSYVEIIKTKINNTYSLSLLMKI